MYTIHADGKLLFDSLSDDVGNIVLSPMLDLSINKAGSLSFTIPPGNSMHRSLKKLKTIVTVEQDGVQIARGRVTETELATYNQNGVYCEGEKSFLLDSVHAPYYYSGDVHGLFQKLIDVLDARTRTRRDTAFSFAVDYRRIVAFQLRHRKDNCFRAFNFLFVRFTELYVACPGKHSEHCLRAAHLFHHSKLL
jgi:hypothetical protein